MSTADLSPVLAEQLQTVLARFDALQGILVSTVEGVPLLRVTTKEHAEADGDNDDGSLSYEYTETVLPTVFAGVSEQIGKLKFGQVKSITSFFGDVVLLHVHAAPLVLTLVAAPSAQIGALQALATPLRDALAPLKRCVDSVDVHN